LLPDVAIRARTGIRLERHAVARRSSAQTIVSSVRRAELIPCISREIARALPPAPPSFAIYFGDHAG
jgi:hypothetical protein